MKLKMIKGTLAATLVFLGLSVGAQAKADTHCATLEGLNETMFYLAFTNEEKDRPSLQGKLDDAQAKLDESKVCNAGQKIDDFNWSLTRLAMADKTKVWETAPLALDCALEGSAALAEAWLTDCEPVPTRPRGKGPKNK